MATTSPDNIWTPNSSEDYDYVIDAAATATSVQNALTRRANSYVGTTAERAAFTASAPEGTLWSDTNGDKILWIKKGASWQGVWSGANTILIDGVQYPASGLFPIPPAYTLSGSSPVFYASWTWPRPFEPPVGYGFIPHLTRTYRLAYISATDPSAANLEIRYVQVHSSTPDANLRVGWRLLPV